MSTVAQLVENARRLGHQTQTVAASAAFTGYAGVRSLCIWCAETVYGRAYRVPCGGECEQCTQVGADVIIIDEDDIDP